MMFGYIFFVVFIAWVLVYFDNKKEKRELEHRRRLIADHWATHQHEQKQKVARVNAVPLTPKVEPKPSNPQRTVYRRVKRDRPLPVAEPVQSKSSD